MLAYWIVVHEILEVVFAVFLLFRAVRGLGDCICVQQNFEKVY